MVPIIIISMLLLSIFVNGETNFGGNNNGDITEPTNGKKYAIFTNLEKPGMEIDEHRLGIGKIYAISTGDKTDTNYIYVLPNTDTPKLVLWWFDGTHKPMTDLPYSTLSGIPPWRLNGPQIGLGIILFGGKISQEPLSLQGFGIFMCWNYTEIPPQIVQPYPDPDMTNVSIKANFTWGLNESYTGEKEFVTYTVKIIDSYGHVEPFRVKGRRYLDLREENFTLKYNSTYLWWVEGVTETGKAIKPDPNIGEYPWKFITQRDPNAPNKPRCACPPDGGINVPTIDFILAWFGGDIDEYDLVRYHIYINDSAIVDDNSFFKVTTDYYPWYKDFVYIIFYGNSSGLKSNTRYYWKIIAEDWDGKTNEGGPWEFTTA